MVIVWVDDSVFFMKTGQYEILNSYIRIKKMAYRASGQIKRSVRAPSAWEQSFFVRRQSLHSSWSAVRRHHCHCPTVTHQHLFFVSRRKCISSPYTELSRALCFSTSGCLICGSIRLEVGLERKFMCSRLSWCKGLFRIDRCSSEIWLQPAH